MLELEEYSEQLIIGLIASVGQLTESLVRWKPLFISYLLFFYLIY